MANVKTKSGLVGLALTGGRIELAAIASESRNARTPQSERLRFECIAMPGFDPEFPHLLPPASALSGLLKSALGRVGVGAGRVAVAVGGSRMALRYFVGSDAHVRGELNQAAERSINYLPFGLGDRLAEQYLHKLEDGRTHALLAVSAAETIDPLIKALEQNGMRVEIIEPALVALARLASLTGRLDETASLLVCANDDGIDIGVVAAGQVLFNRRPMTPESDDGATDQRPGTIDLARELERVSRHYARVFDASHEIRRLLLCGPQDSLAPHLEALDSSATYDIDVLVADKSVAAALSMAIDDASAEGGSPAALGTLAATTDQGCRQIGPDLTSDRTVERRPALAAILPTLLWPALVAAVVWGAVYFTQSHYEKRLARLRIEADHPSLVETRYLELQMQAAQVEQRMRRLTDLREAMADFDPAPLLETVRRCVSDRLWLTQIKLTEDLQIRIDGAAYDADAIYAFQKFLEEAPLVESATIVTTSKSREGADLTTEFTLEGVMKLEPDGVNVASKP